MEIDIFRDRVREFTGTAKVGLGGEETDEYWAEYLLNTSKSDIRQSAKAKGGD